jgi:MFS superfamily sulfate permease-like transporter
MIAVKSGANDSRLGLIFGLIIGLAALCLAGFCSYIGSPIVGGLIGFGGLTGLVSVFVIGKKMNREERENKARFVAEKEKNQNEPSERK